MNKEPYGVVKIIMDPAFFDKTPRVNSYVDEYEQTYVPQLPKTTRDWPKISKCILFESSYNISFSSPSSKGSIRFTTTGDAEGVYDLELQSAPREAGSVLTVKPIPDDDAKHSLFEGLHVYPTRFCVRTSAKDRQGTVRMWLIGILSHIDSTYISNIPHETDPSTSSG